MMRLGRDGLILLVAVATAACGGSRTDPPDVSDDWRPPAGAELDSERLYRENLHLFDYDAAAPLEVEELGTTRHDQVTINELTYASPKGDRVPATLFIPDGDGPFAGLILMHGLPSDRTEMSEPAAAFARLGAVVITIDAPFARPENAGREPLTITSQDRDEQIQLIVDLRRAIDLLVSRGDVDPDRMAYVGVSYGGAMGGLLAGVEDRLSGYVLQVGDGGLVTHLTGPDDQGSSFASLPASRQEAWFAEMWPIEPIHYVSHAAPAVLLFQNGTQDEAVPPADALRYQEAGSEPKTTLWYPAGHGISPAAANDALDWLRDIGGIERLQGSIPARIIDRALVAWSIITLGALAFLALTVWRDPVTHVGTTVVWFLVMAIFGPLGLAAYIFLYRRPRDSPDPRSVLGPARRAIGSAMWNAAGSLVGVSAIALSYSYELWLVLPLPLATGFVFSWLARQPETPDWVWTTHTRPFTVQLTSTNTALVGAYVLIPFALRALDQWYPFGEPVRAIWAMLIVGSVAAVLTCYPIHRWLIGRGVVTWGPDIGDHEASAKKLSMVQAVGLVLASLALLVALVQTATVLAG